MPKNLLIYFLVVTIPGFAQGVRHPHKDLYTGFTTYSKNFSDVFSFCGNQAVLAKLPVAGAGIYLEKTFLLKEVNFFKANIAAPLNRGGVGISASYFGSNDYNESQLGISYGKSLGIIDVGIQFNYGTIRIAGYGNHHFFYVEAGNILHVSELLEIGFHVFNPFNGKRNYRDEKLTSIYDAAAGYEVSDKVFIVANIVHEEAQPINVITGLQYNFAKRIFFRAGISTEVPQVFVGFGLHWKSFRADIVFIHHPQLGFSPALSLIFERDKVQEE